MYSLEVGKLVGKSERALDGKFVLEEGSKCEPAEQVGKQVQVHSKQVLVHKLVLEHSIELVPEHNTVQVLEHNTVQVLGKQDHKLQVHNIVEHE